MTQVDDMASLVHLHGKVRNLAPKRRSRADIDWQRAHSVLISAL